MHACTRPPPVFVGDRSPVETTGDAEFNERVLHSQTPVLVDFCATWCGSCQQLGPVLDEIAVENKRVKLIRVDVDQHRDLAMEYEVRGIPCLILFKNGRIQDRSVGFQSKEAVEAMLRPYR
jgi:thioredoxin 1